MFTNFKDVVVYKRKEMFRAKINDTLLFLQFYPNWISIVTYRHSNYDKKLEYTFNNDVLYYNHLSIGYFFDCHADKKRIVKYEKQIHEFSYNFIGV